MRKFSWSRVLPAGLLVEAQMMLLRQFRLRPFLRHLADPVRSQRKVLKRILQQNRKGGYGIQYGFEKILRDSKRTDDDIETLYRQMVPTSDYEKLRGWIEQTEATEKSGLTQHLPICYARTSGTTDRPKLIPVLRNGLNSQRKDLQIFACAQHRAFPEAFAGKIFAITGPACEGVLPSGRPYGSTSGMIYRDMPRGFRGRYLIPAEVFSLYDYELKYRLILRLGLQCREVTSIAVPNPSTLLVLLSILERDFEEILHEMRCGIIPREGEITPGLRAKLHPLKVPAPDRYEELSALFSPHRKSPGAASGIASRVNRVALADIWPKLRAFATWTGGNCSTTLQSLTQRLGPNVAVIELGYLASECRGSITVDPEMNQSVLAIDSIYFEFVERSSYEAGTMRFESAATIERGKEYYVFVTTEDGLYRYDMNDVLRVTGFVRKTPAVSFVGKGRGVTSLTGEKLNEWQAVEAIRLAAQENQTPALFFIGLASLSQSRYDFYVEFSRLPPSPVSAFADRLDHHLKTMNIEYASKRDSGRIAPPRVFPLKPGTHEAYRRFHSERRGNDWQFKIIALGYFHEELFDLAGAVQSGTGREASHAL